MSFTALTACRSCGHTTLRALIDLGEQPLANALRAPNDDAKDLRADGHRARILHANNVLAHVPDINDFVAAMEILLDDDGVLVIETPHAVAMVEGNEFDTIYHEHVFYYTLTAIETLFARHG